MTIYQWLCLLGIPTLIAAILGLIVGFFRSVKAVKKGVQALLRGQMINEYNKWMDRKYAPMYARDNFQNLWTHYETLGENGVMQDIHDRFLLLPTEPPKG